MAIAGGDWRDTDFYARFLLGDRRCFAWEWLRRTPTYVDAWSTNASSGSFGLAELADPGFDALAARPIWSAAIDSGVLQATGRLAAEGDRLDFSRLGSMMTMVSAGQGRTHILLSDGLRSIRVDLIANDPVSVPLRFTWHIGGIRGIGRQIAALAQLAALVKHGCFLPSLHPSERRAARWTLMLRVHDGLAAGASIREIVANLFGVETAGPRWRIDAAPWRLRVQRLAAGARKCLAAGPAEWLSDRAG